jgi:PAS domain S-box-containing protein
MSSTIQFEEEIIRLKTRIQELELELLHDKKYESYLSMLQKTAISLINRHDLDDLLGLIIIEAVSFMDSKNGFIFLLEPNETSIKLRVGAGIFEKYIGNILTFDECLVEEIWNTGEKRVISDFNSSLISKPSFLKDEPINAIVCIPIKTDEIVVGIFGITYDYPLQNFSNHEIDLLNGFVELCLIALANAKLFTYIQEEFSEIIRVEEELRESEDRYKKIYERVNEPIFIHDEKHFIECNDQMLDFLGITSDELIGKSLYDVSPAYQNNNILSTEIWKNTSIKINEGKRLIIDWQFRTSHETPIRTKIDISKIFLRGNEYLIGIITQIDYPKNKPTENLISELSSNTIFDYIQEGIATIDEFERIKYCNNAFIDILDIDTGNIKGLYFLDLVETSNKQKILRQIEERKKGSISILEIKITTLKGNKKYIRLSASPYFDRNREYKGSIIEVLDITERKKTEKALLLSEEKLSAAFHNISDSVFIINDKGIIIEANESSERITGFNREELINANILELKIIQPDFYVKIADMITKHGFVKNLEHKYVNPLGKEALLLLSADIIEISDNKFILFVARDISNERKLQEELFKALKLESIGILAGGLAHNYNNILTGILGNISLSKLFSKPGEKIYERLNEAEKNTIKAKELTQQLITFAKGGDPIKKLAPIPGLLNNIVQKLLIQQNIGFDLTFPEETFSIEYDETQLKQAIIHIIKNAIEAISLNKESGYISIICSLCELDLKNPNSPQTGKYLKISISDNGIGISKLNIKKIFDPFFTTKVQHRGIGLSIAYSIIKKHGGILEVFSDENKGSKFDIYLPTNCPENKTEKETLKFKGRILLMDDEETVREFAGEIFSHFGHEGILTQNAEETIKIFKEYKDSNRPIDIAILDLTIPGGPGGKEVIKLLKDIDPDLKGIVTTGYSDDEVVAQYSKYGFDDRLIKPYEISEFERILKKYFK